NNAGELRVIDCTSIDAGGYGFYLGTGAGASGAGCDDSHFIGCTSGGSANHGWSVTSGSWNNMFVNCKSFFAGTVNEGSTWGTTQCGFEISTTQNNSFVNCSPQSRPSHGFTFRSN